MFNDIFERLAKSKFRSRFKLRDKEKQYIQDKGLDKIRSHAEDFISKRLAPADILTVLASGCVTAVIFTLLNRKKTLPNKCSCADSKRDSNNQHPLALTDDEPDKLQCPGSNGYRGYNLA